MPDDAATILLRIRELLVTRKYEWARDTLEGIARRIGQERIVTRRQQEAVEHIMIGRLKHDVREVSE